MKTFKMKLMLFGMLFLAPAILQAQTEDKGKSSSKYEDDEVFIVAEQLPTYPGGEEARVKFLIDNIIYPKTLQEKGIKGKVVARFIVEKDGSISNAEIIRSLDPILDKEVLRVVKLMPKWKPGMQKGEPIRCYFSMPVTFELD